MHVIYAHDTVDEAIYGKEDWSDLTGAEANRYWLWPLDPALPPEQQPGPPREPRPTEEAEWKRFGEKVPAQPERWLGELPDLEFSVDTRGNVTTSEGAFIENPQGVAEMVERVRGRPGGRFRLTPVYSLVIVFGEAGNGMVPMLVGRVDEPFRVAAAAPAADVDASALRPGDRYPGPTDKSGGTYKLRQKHGGVIERKSGPEVQFAITEQDTDPRSANARNLLAAWISLNTAGLTFSVNSLGHAWYREQGEVRFMAAVPGGFLWPDGAGVPSPSTDTSSEA
jgi:hypothetical protein